MDKHAYLVLHPIITLEVLEPVQSIALLLLNQRMVLSQGILMSSLGYNFNLQVADCYSMVMYGYGLLSLSLLISSDLMTRISMYHSMPLPCAVLIAAYAIQTLHVLIYQCTPTHPRPRDFNQCSSGHRRYPRSSAE